MDEGVPEPLTVKKWATPQGSSRSQSFGSSTFYPQIPRRRSSLTASVSNSSVEPATSTRTPSLSDSLYQIEIVKVRQSGVPRVLSQHSSSSDDPFVDKPCNDSQRHALKNGFNPLPRLVVRWSSGSWDRTGPCLSSSSANSSVDTDTDTASSTSGSRHRIVSYGLRNFNSLCPMDLPATYVSVKAETDKVHIGMEATSLWTTVYVTADVSAMSFPGSSGLAPLDVLILLDSISQPSVNLLAQVTLGSSVLASHLTQNHDKVALACVDGATTHGYHVLLPLGFHSTEGVRDALNAFSRYQSLKNKKPVVELGNAIRQASSIFHYAPRAAFCHLFFVSATPPSHFSIPDIHQNIGFHTITPQACFPLENATSRPGWHISYNVGVNDATTKQIPFSRKVSRVIRQLRSGMRPGSILDLKLSVAPLGGCQIQSVAEDCRLISLRPGETWSVPVQIRVPAAVQKMSEIEESDPVHHHPLIEDMLSQINFLLEEYSFQEIMQPILTAQIEYQHSLLPTDSSIHAETHLTLVREKPALFK